MSTIVAHLEKYLGLIDRGWKVKRTGEDKMVFGVTRFTSLNDTQVPYCTVGLSKVPLRSPTSGKQIHLELLFLAPPGFGDRNIPAILEDLGNEAIGTRTAYLCGEVLGPRGVLFSGTEFTALYVASPVYLPDEFHYFDDDQGWSSVIAWLVPITDAEAEFVAQRGWHAFDDLLVELDPDLLDFDRTSVV